VPPPPAGGLRFGVASADHQCEAYDAAYEDVRDIWERRRSLTARDRATDFWNRYPEDVALAQSLGCRAFRFSIAWSRVEPSPGRYDGTAFAHYRDLIERVLAAGMEPVVTLHHYTWPVHVERAGGMIAPEFPEVFARYTGEVARRIGAGVRYWITFNEPNQLVYGYVKPWWARAYYMPPGLHPEATTEEQMDAVARLIRNLFLAHANARTAVVGAQPEAKVGVNPLLLGLPGWLQAFIDYRATRVRTPRDLMRTGKRFTERTILEHGEVDVVIAQMTVTQDRTDDVAFSECYFVAALAMLARVGTSFASRADLAGKKVGVVASTTAESDAADVLPDADAVAFPTLDAARRALDDGEVAAILGDDVILAALVDATPGRYRLLDDRLRDEPYAAAVARGNRELLNTVDWTIRSFKESGEWTRSVARNLGLGGVAPPTFGRRSTLADLAQSRPVSVVPVPSRQRSAKVLRAIKRRGYLRVGVRDGAPGLCSRDASTGEYTGLEVDVAREIARAVFGDPARVRFVPLATAARIDSVRSFVRVLDPLLRTYGLLGTLLSSNWWYLGMSGRLREFLCPKSCVGALDFVGVDYYWGVGTLQLARIGRLFDAIGQRYSLAPVQPYLLYDILRSHAKMFPGKEIVVIENGCVDEASGYSRVRYLREHVQQVRRAIADGVPVTTYLCWSITSNREWGAPFGKNSDFGLFHVDLDGDAALRRVATDACDAYRRLAAGEDL
jgi:beta-glucosidase/6-phospho-beta-glucosidase/beta-galactosidase/ABC-type amino acid transport substrate-binding protein